MQTYLKRLDDLAGVSDSEGPAIRRLERIAFVFLVLMVVAAPHSIAATQTAWLTGMFAWLVSVGLRWRSGQLRRDVSSNRLLHIALWAFFVWSVITSLSSYAPD